MLNGCFTDSTGTEYIECIIVKISKRDIYEHELEKIKEKLEEAYKLKEEALNKENKLRNLFETILFSIYEGIIVTNNQGNVLMMNKLAERYTGWKAEEALKVDLNSIFYCTDIQTRERRVYNIKDVLKSKGGYMKLENLILTAKDGEERFIMGTTASILAKDGLLTGMVTSFRDITKEYLQEKEIDSFLNVNMEMLCVYNQDGNFYKVNNKFSEILGYGKDEIIGKNFLDLVHGEDKENTILTLKDIVDRNKVYDLTNRFCCKDGSYKYLEWHIQLGAGKYAYSSARDVTAKMLETENLKTIAIKDRLTNLYNRHYLDMVLEDDMKRADAYREPLTMAILDLDRFKLVNDTWGHPIGDEQLKLTAETAGKNLRASDLLVRFGGEEFVVVMSKTDIEEAVALLDRVRQAIEENNHPVTGRQTVSIGAAKKFENETFEEWYKRTDEALYRAKNEGRNRVVAYD